jgi:phenylalanyl-tRNA synthetase alpha chain
MSAQDLITHFEKLGDEFAAAIVPVSDEQAIRATQARFIGRIKELMNQLSKLPKADRGIAGAAYNKVKDGIEGTVARRLAELADAASRADLARVVDVTLPASPIGAGHVHLLTQVRQEAVAVFAELGFVVADGPQIETDWHNFEALGIPRDHPARDMQDTFYISDEILLRSHTSPVQIRTMLTQPPPVRIVAPGVVFRRDDDLTHSPMFTQLEGLCVDEGVSFADLKGVLLHFVKRFFARELAIRLRPSYFQFTEPSAEVDVQCVFCGGPGCRVCKQTGWLEIGGSGMVDPVVFEHVGIDAERYTGFAFGMGLERMAMLRHGVDDIKYYYEGDVRFLEQF